MTQGPLPAAADAAPAGLRQEPPASAGAAAPTAALRWTLLYGNFVIGCGVMVVAGSLNDLTRSLQVSVALGGQLIAIAAAVMCFGAPLLAAAVGRADRRTVLVWALAWYGVGHAACAFSPDYPALALLRGVSVLGAALFTPQAAAAIGAMTPPEQRGRAITFIFLGWSVASVIGMPVHSYIGEAFGWRYAFGLVAALAAVGCVWLARLMPRGVRPPPMSLGAWRDALTRPALVAIVGVTALQSAGQFTLFSYFAPYYKQVLGAGASGVSGLFFWFGAFGLLGNVLLARSIDRVGASRAVALQLVCISLSLLAWPWATSVGSMMLVLIPWAMGCFAANSGQQARLGLAAPALAPALMALNTSAIYLGQAAGAASGGWLLARHGFAPLHWVALGWLLVALALSLWAGRRLLRDTAAGHA
ncbi:MFS transporter [Ideonella sp. BN130291]|uniref:MFS transporter n=1 Tax=Ideonella sp. BN130291 TaxID=3112940 RepID=UPI002E258C50|nr:MFS transporter [Ideonella sp. BN130291]